MTLNERAAFEKYEHSKNPLAKNERLFEVFTKDDLNEEELSHLGKYLDSFMQEKWELWQKAKAIPEGFCIVPIEMNNFDAYILAHRDFKQNKILFDMENRGLTDCEVELRKLKWLLWKVNEIKKAYKHFVGWISGLGAEE